MRTDHQLAENLIARQFSSSPREGRLPLADHGTECLAGSLWKGRRGHSEVRREVSVTRTGKIARLPQAVREELNRRRRETEPGGPLAEAYGGGEAGRPAAALVLELWHDLEPGTLTRKPEPGPAESNPVKPSQT